MNRIFSKTINHETIQELSGGISGCSYPFFILQANYQYLLFNNLYLFIQSIIHITMFSIFKFYVNHTFSPYVP